MKHIILYGHLAKKFGRHHHFDVRTPSEAIRALKANFPGFAQHIMQHNEPGYHVRVGKDYRDEEGLTWPVDGTIKIIPAVTGASAFFKVVLGAALLYFAPVLATSSFFGAATVGSLASSIGTALIIGGISQVLFKPPQPQQGSMESAENKPSYVFDGPVNTVAQGNPVPICYGELLVGSQVVSASLDTGDISL